MCAPRRRPEHRPPRERHDDRPHGPRSGYVGQMPPYFGMPQGHPPVRSYLAIPVQSRGGAVLGGLFFGHADAAVFGDREERVKSRSSENR